MSRKAKIWRNIAIGVVLLIGILATTTILVVRTAWFQDFARRKVISAVEEATGGRVEIGSFSLSLAPLRVVIANFVIHGKEPPGAEPYLRARRLQAEVRLFTSLRHPLDITYLGIERPEANILVFADGSTNVPSPRKKSTSNTTALETVVDLAVRHFELNNGLLTFNSRRQPLDVRGNNLRVQLWYDGARQGYQGQLALDPLYVLAGKNTPVNFTITLPVALGRDRIDFRNARIATAASELRIDGALENLRDPRTTARISGHVALADIKNAGNLPIVTGARNVSSALDLEANATVAGNAIEVNTLRLGLGSSQIRASGKLKDASGNGSLAFEAALAVGELGRLAKVPARPDGLVNLNGTARLDQANNYLVQARLDARALSFDQGSQRIRNVSLFSNIRMDPHRLDLQGLRLAAFGGELAADASLAEFARYQVRGNLRHLDIGTAARTFGVNDFAYSGVISGPLDAEGNLKAPGASSVVAHARLSISPGGGGIPLSGRLTAGYRGSDGNIQIERSYLALPHTRLNLDGSLGNHLDVALRTRDLRDLLAATGTRGPAPVVLEGGRAAFLGSVTGSLSSPQIAGHLAVNRFSVEGRRFDDLALDAAASPSRATVSNGTLRRGPMQTQFAAAVGLAKWKATPDQPVSLDASVRDGDLADVMVLAGQPPAGYSGPLSADAHVRGTVGNPTGTATLQVAAGTLHEEPFDNIQAQVNLADQLVTIPSASLTAGAARVNLTAEFQHPRDSFSTGRLHAHVQSNQVDLAKIHNVQKGRPNTGGVVELNADVTGNLSEAVAQGKKQTEFLLSSANADASARNLLFDGQNFGDFTATARTSGQTVRYEAASNFAGSNIRLNGNTQLARGYPTEADANIEHLPVERILLLAKRTDIPAKGSLSGTAHVQGTLENPQGNVNLDLANAVLYDEPIDHVRARVAYLPQSIDLPQLEILAGSASITLSAHYDHPAGDLQTGSLQFRVASSHLDLAKIRNLQNRRPGLGGAISLAGNGAATIRQGEPRVLFQTLTAELAARNVSANGNNFGDLTLNAATNAGQLKIALDSNLAQSAIHGEGTAQLRGDYPVDARLTFGQLAWTRLRPLIGSEDDEPSQFEALVEGQAAVSGPLLKSDNLKGTLQIGTLRLNNIPGPGRPNRPVVIENQGPILASLDGGVAKLTSLRLAGPKTDIRASGSISAKQLTANLSAQTDLNLLQQFNRDIVSSGNIVLAATVRGTSVKPLVNGRLELQKASLNYTELPNGISNANGAIVFNGNTASVRNLTAEMGGGKVTIGGFFAYTEAPRFSLRATANGVRMRLQPGVSAVASANLNVSGRPQSSLATGTVTIEQVTYAPQSDFGSILSRSEPPVQSPTTPSALLDNMKLDVQVLTAASMTVQASQAQNLQADANLRIRGTASQPGILGRISISEGQLVFFGSTYTVNSGTISFYNPVRIEPVLNISLETESKGVDVVLRVTGPIDNMKLTYTSDPPLQFQEIVTLLASGKTPTSDPTILANQPTQPSQSFQQMGESAIVSKALADPVANQLQRVFGVNQLKIDPAFTSGSDLPQARLTLQQQVASNLTFTYVTALNDPNTQIIRVEWAFNPQWSAVAKRDQNGIVSLNFLYKRQLR
ncbi:MAG TPA: translocation/assembly module TamB domain-containing protein [Bryobacteraceae bacterium]|nr:translocation/assembly module TamB domain-containing protein [Bryobacteraceae bacterium]